MFSRLLILKLTAFSVFRFFSSAMDLRSEVDIFWIIYFSSYYYFYFFKKSFWIRLFIFPRVRYFLNDSLLNLIIHGVIYSRSTFFPKLVIFPMNNSSNNQLITLGIFWISYSQNLVFPELFPWQFYFPIYIFFFLDNHCLKLLYSESFTSDTSPEGVGGGMGLVWWGDG